MLVQVINKDHTSYLLESAAELRISIDKIKSELSDLVNSDLVNQSSNNGLRKKLVSTMTDYMHQLYKEFTDAIKDGNNTEARDLFQIQSEIENIIDKIPDNDHDQLIRVLKLGFSKLSDRRNQYYVKLKSNTNMTNESKLKILQLYVSGTKKITDELSRQLGSIEQSRAFKAAADNIRNHRSFFHLCWKNSGTMISIS